MTSIIATAVSTLALAATPAVAQEVSLPANVDGPEAIEMLNEMQLAQLKENNERVVAATVTTTQSSATKTADKTWDKNQKMDKSSMDKSEKDWSDKKMKKADKDYKSTDQASNTYTDATITEVAMSDPQFSTLTMLLKDAGIADEIRADGEYTVFAPTNAAFDKLSNEQMEELKRDPTRLEETLKAHVLDGIYMASDVPEVGAEFETLGQATLMLERASDGTVTAGSVPVMQADIVASNGVIHVIDDVIELEYQAESVLSKSVGS